MNLVFQKHWKKCICIGKVTQERDLSLAWLLLWQKCQAKVFNQACKILKAAFCQKFYFCDSPMSVWFPGLMCFAISFAASSTCWYWTGDRPVPKTKSLFHCHIPSSATFGKGIGSYRPSLASIQPSPVLASGPSWMSNVLWIEIWPVLSWAIGTGKRHVGNVLCTVLVMKENSSFNSKTFSCAEPILRQPPRTLILGAHGNTQSLSEGEFSPPLPQQDDEKVTPVSIPLLICPQWSEWSHLWECEVLSRFPLLLIA